MTNHPAHRLAPRLVGIVNLTEDSFSDGGLYLRPDAAIAHALQLRADGADIIELGPASSHPDATPVSAAAEQRRLAPVLEHLVPLGIPLSVDSFQPETQRFALAHGVAYLNDIQGFPDPDLYPALASADCHLVVMHSIQRQGKASRVRTDPETIEAAIDDFFTRRLAVLRLAGVPAERLIIDPGLGFFLGATPAPSLRVLGRIRRLRDAFGLPVLISASRKSFLRTVTGRGIVDAGPASLGAELYAALAGVDYIRTHDVCALRDALTVFNALVTAREAIFE